MTAIGQQARDVVADVFTKGVEAAIADRGRKEIKTQIETRAEVVPDDILKAIDRLSKAFDALNKSHQMLSDRVGNLEKEEQVPVTDTAYGPDVIDKLYERLEALERKSDIVEDHHEAINNFVSIASGLSGAIKAVRRENDEKFTKLLSIAANMQAEIKQAAGVA